MARPRLELQAELKQLVDNVYFQPPNSQQMVYPCIVYKLTDMNTTYGGNNIYRNAKRYTVTVIDRDPDSTIPDALLNLPYVSYNRRFTADGLNHDVFTLYF